MREQSNGAKSKVDADLEDIEDELLLDDSDIDDVSVDVDEDDIEDDKDDQKNAYTPGNIPDGQLDATRLYLGEIGYSPLLTAEEEVHYSRMAQRGEEAGRKK